MKGSIIAMMMVQMIHPTHTITSGSIAVQIFLTVSSISLLNLRLILVRSFERFQVCSHIFTTEESSIGKSGFSFHD